MRVLLASNHYPPFVVGGAEVVAHRHARHLRERGHDVVVFAGRVPQAAGEHGTFECTEIDGITVYRLSIRSLDPGDNYAWEAAARHLRAIAAYEKPDVIHFHNVIGLGANLIPEARRLGIKSVVTLHDHWGFCYKNTLLRNDDSVCRKIDECYQCTSHVRIEDGHDIPMRLRRDYVAWCVDQAGLLVAPSRYLATAYDAALGGEARVLTQSNGIDVGQVERRETAPSSRVRFTFVGYLGEHKGLALLLKAIDALLADPSLDERWQLKIVGGGHLEAWLSQEIDGRQAPETLKLLGRLTPPEVRDALAETDVLVLPSIWPENEPVVMLEAIATGVAQIASGHGGNTELVEHGKSGFLFEPGNAESLVAAMRTYIAEPALAAAHGSYNARRRAAFDETAAVDAYLTHYAATPSPADIGPPSAAVIICAGGWPSLDVAQLVNTAYAFSLPGTAIRFISEHHACNLVWEQASAVWIWSERPSASTILRALRAGLPIVAPREHTVARGLEMAHGAALTYADKTEALAVLTVVAREKAALRRAMPSCSQIADVIAETITSEQFTLSTQRP